MKLAFNPSCNETSRFPSNDSYEQSFCAVVSYRRKKKEEMVVGDVKDGFQVLDHDGWIKLDGRLRASLKTTQRVRAIDLGFGVNIPDATGSYTVQNGQTLGSLTGSNNRTIQQSDLPNVSLPGVVGSSGAHTHTATTSAGGLHNHNVTTEGLASPNGTTPGYSFFAGGGEPINHTTGVYVKTSTSNGSHTHALTTATNGGHTHTVATILNGGVTQTTLNVTPLGLSVNKFVYLGL